MKPVGFVVGTQTAYLRAFDRFEARLDRKSGATATVRDARRYLTELKRQGMAATAYIHAAAALKFFFEKTLKRDWSLTGVPTPKRQKKVPVILTQRAVLASGDAHPRGPP